MPAFLEVHNLEKSFGRVHAVDGIDIVIDEPGLHGFLGPNGAGKTTTIKLIAGLLRPDNGSITVCGEDAVADHVSAAGRLGLMMETPPFYPHLSGTDNLRVLARLSGLGGVRRVEELLERVDLTRDASRRVGGYSRGMRQRLGLAAALLDDPPFLVLDEPTNGLDPEGIIAIRNWLPHLVDDRGKAILMSSHQLGEVERICDRLHIISQGKIRADGRFAELIRTMDEFEVRLNDAESWIDKISNLGGVQSVSVKAEGCLSVIAPGSSAAELTIMLRDTGIPVDEVIRKRESLEDVFLRVIGTTVDASHTSS